MSANSDEKRVSFAKAEAAKIEQRVNCRCREEPKNFDQILNSLCTPTDCENGKCPKNLDCQKGNNQNQSLSELFTALQNAKSEEEKSFIQAKIRTFKKPQSFQEAIEENRGRH